MQVTKRIVILANSVKHYPNRCIAGREMLEPIGGRPQAGCWVRPVSDIGEGELLPDKHMQVAGGGDIEILDIFEVGLRFQMQDPLQPENWTINASVPWKRIGRWPADHLNYFTEFPPDLWREPMERSDRVTAGYLKARLPMQSLYIIVPFTARIYRTRGRYRLSFAYLSENYDVSVTDPVARVRFDRACGDICLEKPSVCVSLTPLFKGYHYKVAAMIIW